MHCRSEVCFGVSLAAQDEIDQHISNQFAEIRFLLDDDQRVLSIWWPTIKWLGLGLSEIREI